MPSPTTRADMLLQFLESKLRGGLRKAYEQAQQSLRKELNLAALERALERGNLGEALSLVADASGPAKEILRHGFASALTEATGHTFARETRAIAPTMITLAPGTSRASEVVSRLERQFFPPVFDESADALRTIFQKGLQDGLNPRTIAVTARSSIGLTPYDHSLADSFQLQLESGRYREALGRGLRDARYDARLRSAEDGGPPLTRNEISKMTERYTERLHKWRAETWTRTATLNSAREGQLLAWKEAVASYGDLGNFEATKKWNTTMDGKERPAHADANGIVVGINETFPVDGGVQTPGQGVYNCRCAVTMGLRRIKQNSFLNSPKPSMHEELFGRDLSPDQKEKKRLRAIARRLKGKGLPVPDTPKVVITKVVPPTIEPLPVEVVPRTEVGASIEASKTMARSSEAYLQRAREIARLDLDNETANVNRERRKLQDAMESIQRRFGIKGDGLPSGERENLNTEWWNLQKQQSDLAIRLETIRAEKLVAIRKQLAAHINETVVETLEASGQGVDEATHFNFVFEKKKPTPDESRLLDESKSFFNKIFPKAREGIGSEQKIGTARITGRPRSFAVGIDHSINMTKTATTRVWVHEMAHLFEYEYLQAGEWGAFERERRATSSVAKKLAGYAKDERFLPGTYIRPYMGKVYSNTKHTEMLSMALEMLYDDPAKLLQEDPDLFNSLLEFIRHWRNYRRPSR